MTEATTTTTNANAGEGHFLGWPDCDRCHKPVTNPRRAALSLDTGAARRQQQAGEDWHRAKTAEKVAGAAAEDGDGPRLILFSARELMQSPALHPVPWVWTHDRCAPARGDYEISGERLGSLGKVLDWTLHLAEKTWFDHWAWEQAVRRFWRLPQA